MNEMRFVFTELHTSDPEKARAFYGKLLGWMYRDAAMPSGRYAFISMDGTTVGGITRTSRGASSWLLRR